VHQWDADLPIHERDWSVGLIVGPSGAGKSVLGRELFPDALFVDSAFPWPNDQSVLDGFGETHETRDVVAALSSVGLSSPPHWLKPYAHLSNGQRFRCDLARALLSDRELVVFDEFTSVVDRDVAKVCSSAVAKAIRKRKSPRFVALSCHFDIIEWLQPDWVYDVAAARFEWRQLRRRPPIKLSIHRVDPASAWPLFRGHHYLSSSLAMQARAYCAFWEEKPVGFFGIIHHVGRAARDRRVRAYRGHRTVVLPDYQGVGIGNVLQEAIAGLYVAQGFRFYLTAAHPAVIHHMSRSKRWRMVRHPSQLIAKAGGNNDFGGASRGRLTASFEYIGENLLAGAPSLT
jgi:GNAT superfamily N-acetyltransferase